MKPNTTELKIPDKYLRGGHDKKYTLFKVPNKQILKWAMPLLEEIYLGLKFDKYDKNGWNLTINFLDYLENEVKPLQVKKGCKE